MDKETDLQKKIRDCWNQIKYHEDEKARLMGEYEQLSRQFKDNVIKEAMMIMNNFGKLHKLNEDVHAHVDILNHGTQDEFKGIKNQRVRDLTDADGGFKGRRNTRVVHNCTNVDNGFKGRRNNRVSGPRVIKRQRLSDTPMEDMPKVAKHARR